jgi:hypothetical protein
MGPVFHEGKTVKGAKCRWVPVVPKRLEARRRQGRGRSPSVGISHLSTRPDLFHDLVPGSPCPSLPSSWPRARRARATVAPAMTAGHNDRRAERPGTYLRRSGAFPGSSALRAAVLANRLPVTIREMQMTCRFISQTIAGVFKPCECDAPTTPRIPIKAGLSGGSQNQAGTLNSLEAPSWGPRPTRRLLLALGQ